MNSSSLIQVLMISINQNCKYGFPNFRWREKKKKKKEPTLFRNNIENDQDNNVCNVY